MALTIGFSAEAPETIATDLLALGVFEGPPEKQPEIARLDGVLNVALIGHAERSDFEGHADQVLDLSTLDLIPARRILLVGLGKRRGWSDARLRAFTATVARAAASCESLAVVLPPKTSGPAMRAAAEGIAMGAYRFTKYLTGDRAPKQSLLQVAFVRTGERVQAVEKKAVALGSAVADAVARARDMVNEPANVLTPAALADHAQEVAEAGGLEIEILDKEGIEAAGMHLHYAVGKGSVNEPRFVHMKYLRRRPKKRLVFVGKGLTFDSGGLCIKPPAGMEEMKTDMSGAAAVLGLMAAVAALRPNVEVHGIIGAAENMPDAAAYRPGDVLASLDGKTVEVINTDAEGRLVLADALTYARRLEPDAIVDAATLTGACMVALGKRCSAYYCSDERLARQFDAASRQAGEQFWRMPLLEDIREQLKSQVADLKHIGDRWGGSISAALFLREFVGDVPWIHCDIAGPVLSDKPQGIYPKGATGHAVLTFLRMVENAAK